MIETIAASETRTAPPPAESPPTPASAPFTPEEVTAMQTEDRLAAGMVAGIMSAILALGLIGYTVIALIVAGGN